MIPTLNRQGMAMGAVLALFGIFLILPLILTLSGGFESKGVDLRHITFLMSFVIHCCVPGS